MGLTEFFYEYFVAPIKENTGYNPVNTFVYGVILAVAVFLLYRLLKRMGISVNERFFRALMPYIILGPLLRSMTDVGILPRTYLTVSPGAYFVIAGFAIASLYVVWKNVGVGEKLYSLYFEFGLILLAGLVFILLINAEKVSVNLKVLAYFVPALIGAEAVVWLLSKKIQLIRDNSTLFYTHFYDATTTFIGIDFFGFWEQHVLARWLIDLTGTAATMYLEKFIVLLPVVWALDRVLKDEDPDLINFVKLAVFILGFGPGTRNLLIMLMGG